MALFKSVIYRYEEPAVLTVNSLETAEAVRIYVGGSEYAQEESQTEGMGRRFSTEQRAILAGLMCLDSGLFPQARESGLVVFDQRRLVRPLSGIAVPPHLLPGIESPVKGCLYMLDVYEPYGHYYLAKTGALFSSGDFLQKFNPVGVVITGIQD